MQECAPTSAHWPVGPFWLCSSLPFCHAGMRSHWLQLACWPLLAVEVTSVLSCRPAVTPGPAGLLAPAAQHHAAAAAGGCTPMPWKPSSAARPQQPLSQHALPESSIWPSQQHEKQHEKQQQQQQHEHQQDEDAEIEKRPNRRRKRRRVDPEEHMANARMAAKRARYEFRQDNQLSNNRMICRDP